jgi:nitrite reductase/ring-hydroxylating ferredoxin subunit/uncharacterized membrane protein
MPRGPEPEPGTRWSRLEDLPSRGVRILAPLDDEPPASWFQRSEAGKEAKVNPLARETLAGRIERMEQLDTLAGPLQAAVGRLVPQATPLKDVLSGTWLGHPLHPPLTDLVVGSWTSALLLDLLGGEAAEDGADTLVGVGILAALPTAASGLSDWAELRGGTRRVGAVHALGNTSALVLHALSWLARKRRHRARGLVLSSAGVAIAGLSAWLGGDLSFAQGVGVNQTAFEDLPSEWTRIASLDGVPDAGLTAATADGTPIVLARKGDEIWALADRCSHRGCALHEGRLEGETIVCPCHGSSFRRDGTIARGPATAPQPSLQVRVSDGELDVRRAEAP